LLRQDAPTVLWSIGHEQRHRYFNDARALWFGRWSGARLRRLPDESPLRSH